MVPYSFSRPKNCGKIVVMYCRSLSKGQIAWVFKRESIGSCPKHMSNSGLKEKVFICLGLNSLNSPP